MPDSNVSGLKGIEYVKLLHAGQWCVCVCVCVFCYTQKSKVLRREIRLFIGNEDLVQCGSQLCKSRIAQKDSANKRYPDVKL